MKPDCWWHQRGANLERAALDRAEDAHRIAVGIGADDAKFGAAGVSLDLRVGASDPHAKHLAENRIAAHPKPLGDIFSAHAPEEKFLCFLENLFIPCA